MTTPIDLLADGRNAVVPQPLVQIPKSQQTTVLAVGVSNASTAPAICAVRYGTVVLFPGDPMYGERPIYETHYTVLGAEELAVGAPYTAVAQRVNTLARRLYNADSKGDYHVLVDASDVGAPAVDMIRDSIIPQAHVTAVTIGPGDAGDMSTLWRREAAVGLLYLISRLQAILQGKRLHAPQTPAIVRVLETLRDYDARDMRGVDLVRVLALACCTEYQPVLYDVSPELLPSARM